MWYGISFDGVFMDTDEMFVVDAVDAGGKASTVEWGSAISYKQSTILPSVHNSIPSSDK